MNARYPFAALTITLLLLSACSLLPGAGGAAPAESVPAELGTGRSALAANDWAAARASLIDAAQCTATESGREALLLLAATTLDPRQNGAAGVALGAAAAGLYLRLPGTPETEELLARTLYLLALELGADTAAVPAPALLAAADSDAARPAGCLTVAEEALLPWEPPRLTRPALGRRLQRVEEERAEAARRAREGEAARAELQRQLDEALAELERIRKILRP